MQKYVYTRLFIDSRKYMLKDRNKVCVRQKKGKYSKNAKECLSNFILFIEYSYNYV